MKSREIKKKQKKLIMRDFIIKIFINKDKKRLIILNRFPN